MRLSTFLKMSLSLPQSMLPLPERSVEIAYEYYLPWREASLPLSKASPPEGILTPYF